MTRKSKDKSEIQLRNISADTVRDICRLSDTLPPQQRMMVARNGDSIAQAHFSNLAWFRAIYAGETPVGFVMVHEHEEGSQPPGVFLWRLMIAYPHQKKGYGKKALEILFERLIAQGEKKLYTSCVQGEGSPEGFYRKLGFKPTGEMYDEEIELVLDLGPWKSADVSPETAG